MRYITEEEPVSTTPVANPAETYEQYMVPALFGSWAEELVQRAAPQPGERALDLACGTAIVARRVAPLVAPGGRVDALDLNPVMLGEARARAQAEGADISCHQGNMEALPFPDGAYDLVTCQQGLQFVSDRAAAVHEMRRVLVDGGRAVVACWTAVERQPLFAEFAPIIERHAGAGAFNAPYALSNADELRGLFPTAGFAEVAVETVSKTVRFPQPERYIAMSVGGVFAAFPSLQQLSAEERARMTAALSADLDPVARRHIEDDAVVSLTETHIVCARA
jgi:ubiquinone/menaquinone biosynthesis C-methylase UbiE